MSLAIASGGEQAQVAPPHPGPGGIRVARREKGGDQSPPSPGQHGQPSFCLTDLQVPLVIKQSSAAAEGRLRPWPHRHKGTALRPPPPRARALE